MPDLLDDHVGVVDRAVIGALLDHGDAERPLAPPRLLVGDQRVIANFFSDALLVERLVEYGPDQSMGVAVGLEKDRNAAADEERAVMRRLVVVAIEQHEVALGDQGGQHDLVRRRGAVEHEIGLLGSKDRGGLLLRLERRAFMDEQVAQFEHGIVEVVTEYGLAEMLDEDAADRAAVVEDAAVVAGAGPQLIAALAVVDQRAEERRLQRLRILLEPAHQVGGDEFRRLLGEEDVTVDVVEHLDRDVLEPLAPHQHDDRHFEAAPAHQVDQRRGLAFETLLAPVHHHAADGGVGLHRNLGILDPPRPHHLEAELLDGDGDLPEPQPFQVLGVECRRADEKRETPEEIHAPAFSERPVQRHPPDAAAALHSVEQYENQMTAPVEGARALYVRGDTRFAPRAHPAIADHMDYPADHTPVVHARNATRPREKGFNALKLSLSQPELIRHRQVLLPRLNHDVTSDGI